MSPLHAPSLSQRTRRILKFPLSAEKRQPRDNNQRNNKSVSLSNPLASTSSSSSYVPSGLTAEEYQAIRDAEVAARAKKDYGRWGPRFSSDGGPPPGNWFSMPQLWTTGAVTMANPSNLNPEQSWRRRLPHRLWKLAVVDNAAGFLLSVAMVMSWTLAAAWKYLELPASPSLLRPLAMWSALGQFLTLAWGLGLAGFQSAKLWRKSLPFAVVLLSLTPLSQRYLNVMQERWNWSKSRTWWTTIMGFNVLMFLLRRFLVV